MIIAITKDKYEHTMAVTDTVVEMAKLLGVSEQVIYRDCRGKRIVKNKSCVPYRFMKIEVDDETN